MSQPFPMNIGLDEARAAIAALLPTPPSIMTALANARGQRLAADLVARVDHPSATESALDGVACRAADTQQASAVQPAHLQLVGESRAGQAFGGVLAPGQAVHIYTGAPLPEGADAICPVEQLSTERDEYGSEWALLRCPARPQDVRRRGEDFVVGETVLRAGQVLSPERLALAAALGYAEVPIARPWRVAVLATGDEVIEPPTPLLAGQVYNSNSYGLCAQLQELGCEVLRLRTAADTLAALQTQLKAIGPLDLLLTSGGVSMGKYDLVRDLLRQEGQVSFWKVRMRPGGPVIAGKWGQLAVVGLPGNPVSSLVVFRVLLQGVLTGQPPRSIWLPAAETLRGVAGKTAFWRGHVHTGPAGSQVSLYHAQSSGRLRSLSEAPALLRVPEGEVVAVGEWVEVLF